MEVVVNGKPVTIAAPCCVSDLLQTLGVRGRFAVEINERIVPRSAFAAQPVRSGDRVEIVQAIGGG